MSIRRGMLFTLGAKIKNLVDAFKARVLNTQGEFEAESCLNTQLTQLDNQSLLDNASLVVTPNGYRETLLYAVEPSEVGTNLCLWSEQFDNTLGWGFVNASAIGNTTTSPSGLVNADTLTANGTNNPHYMGGANTNLVSGSTYTFSIYAKKNTNNFIQLFIPSTFGGMFANFDLNNGVVGTLGTVTGTAPTSSITNVGNGWYRCTMTFIPNTTGTNGVYLGLVTSASALRIESNSLSTSVYLWGAQLVPGSTITDYISTTDRAIINGTIGDMSVTRATTATRVNSDGFIEQVPYNLFQRSEEFENGIWFRQNILSISTNVANSPIGTLTADKIIPDTTLNQHRIYQSGLVANTVTLSVYAKADGYNFMSFARGGGLAYSSIIFNLSNGTISGTESGVIPSIEDVGNGWYRCLLTITANFGIGTNISSWIIVRNDNTTNNYAGNGTSGILVWGAQLVTGTQAKDYFPTTNRQNVPRIDYSNGSCPSILVEPQRTNLVLQSENLTVSPWIYQNANGVSTNDLNPSGQNSSNRINLLLSGFSSVRQVIPSLNNTTYTISCFFKKIPGFDNSFEMRYTNELVAPNNFNAIAFINPNTKTATFSLSGTNGTGISGSITGKVDLYPNDWFRVSMTFTSGSAAANVNALFRPAILINSTASVLIWGAQLEVGPNTTSYIPTVASTVTRNADVISNTNVSTLIGQTEGAMFVDFNYQMSNPLADSFIATISDGTLSNHLIFAVLTTGNAAAILRTSGTNVIFISIPAASFTFGRKKIVISYKSGETNLYVNGVKIGSTITTAFSFPVTINKFNLGSSGTNGGLSNTTINSSAIYKTTLTDAQAIQLTTL